MRLSPTSTNGNPTKATIKLVTASTSKGRVGKGTVTEQFEVQFNPKEYSIQKSAEWSSHAVTSADPPMPEFKGVQGRTLTLELFLDGTSKESPKVLTTVKKLFECCSLDPKSKEKKKPSGPFVWFHWGQLHFLGSVKQVNVKYTLFDSAGDPLRATCGLTLLEVPTPDNLKEKQNPTSGSQGTTASHRVVAGDTLASIAYGEYEDATLWRAIADANGIDDPLRLAEGAVLLVPPLDRVQALS